MMHQAFEEHLFISLSSLYCMPLCFAPPNKNYKAVIIKHITWKYKVTTSIYMHFMQGVHYTVIKISLIYITSAQIFLL